LGDVDGSEGFQHTDGKVCGGSPWPVVRAGLRILWCCRWGQAVLGRSQLATKIADEVRQKGGGLLRCLLAWSVADTGYQLNLVAPQRGNVQLSQVVEADQLLAATL
jgi:hypothetical protein